jgi:hypothetical protein
LPAPERGKNTAPVILEPVFLRGADGKIAPFKMVWPSYWARLNGTNLTPMLPAEAAKTVTLPQPSSDAAARDPYNTKPLTDRQIQTGAGIIPVRTFQGRTGFYRGGQNLPRGEGVLSASESPPPNPMRGRWRMMSGPPPKPLGRAVAPIATPAIRPCISPPSPPAARSSQKTD